MGCIWKNDVVFSLHLLASFLGENIWSSGMQSGALSIDLSIDSIESFREVTNSKFTFTAGGLDMLFFLSAVLMTAKRTRETSFFRKSREKQRHFYALFK